MDDAFALYPIIFLLPQPSTQLRWWIRPWSKPYPSGMAVTAATSLLPWLFWDFFPIHMGPPLFDPAAVTVSEPRTALGSPNFPLGCHLVLSAESRGASQVLGDAGEGHHLRSSSRGCHHPSGFKMLPHTRL